MLLTSEVQPARSQLEHVLGSVSGQLHVIASDLAEVAKATNDVHAIDNAFRGDLDALRDAVLQEMQHEFDDFVKAPLVFGRGNGVHVTVALRSRERLA